MSSPPIFIAKRHAGEISKLSKQQYGLFHAANYYNWIPLHERSFIVRTSMLCAYARHVNLKKCLEVMPFDEHILHVSSIDLHWTGIMGDTYKVSHQGGVPLDFAILLVENHMCNNIEVITGYNGGTKLKDGLIAHCKEKDYSVYLHPTNQGRMMNKKEKVSKSDSESAEQKQGNLKSFIKRAKALVIQAAREIAKKYTESLGMDYKCPYSKSIEC